MRREPYEISTALCEKEITLDDAERRVAVHLNRPSQDQERHQEVLQRWRIIKDNLRPEDTLWTFSTSLIDWRNRCGMAGIAVVRNKNKVIDYVALIWD